MGISNSERVFITNGILRNIRGDGRKRLEYRSFSIETDVYPGSNGSARVTLRHPDTVVVASVKADISEPSRDHPDEGLVDCSVQFSGGPLGGSPSEALSAHYTQKLNAYLLTSGGLDFHQLSVLPGKFCWSLHVDCTVLENGGNVFDSIILGVYSALHRTILPALIPTPGDEGNSFDIDQDLSHALSLPVDNLPLAATLHVIGQCLVADCTGSEEEIGGSVVSVYVNRRKEMCGVQKYGDTSIEVTALLTVLETSRKIASLLFDRVSEVLQRPQSASPGAPLPT